MERVLPEPTIENVIFLVPARRYIEPEVEHGLRMLEALGYSVLRPFGISAIDQARCEIAYHAMERGSEYLFWIDSDVSFSAGSALQLLSYRLPVVCGIYRTKSPHENAACGEILDVNEGIRIGGGELQEIRYPPGGFTCVHRSAYEATGGDVVFNQQFGRPLKPWYLPLLIDDPSGPRYLAEDFAFGERLRRAGFQIWADPSATLAHVGSYSYRFQKGFHRTSRHMGDAS